MATQDASNLLDLDTLVGASEQGPRGYLRLTADSEAMANACDAAGVSPNALATEGAWSVGSPVASVTSPSYFVDDARFGALLAYFVEMGLWFAVDLEFESRTERAGASVRLYPALDAQTLELMNQIAPGRGDRIRELQNHLQQFLDSVNAPERLSPEPGEDE